MAAAEQLAGADLASPGVEVSAILALGWPGGSARGRWAAEGTATLTVRVLEGDLMRECVGAVIIQDESILLGKRSADRTFYPNVWDVFGGHIESGESHQQALERELVEELGIVPTGCRYLETLSAPSPTEDNGIECHLYVVTEWNGRPANRQPQEHSEIKWFRFGEALHLELAVPEYARIINNIRPHATKVDVEI